MGLSCRAALLGGVCAAALGASARAEEGPVAYLAGVNLGIPVAAAPPPGVYGSATNYYKPMTVYNGSGDKTPIKAGVNGTTLSVLYSPGVRLLGGDYFAFLRQPVLFNSQTTDFFGHSSTVRQNGIFNTIVSPINISWMLVPGQVFVAAGLVVYLKDATYSHGAALNIGNNFYTFEPSLAVAYFHKGWQLSALGLVDVNTADNSSTNALAVNGNYQSGAVFSLEANAIYNFGPYAAGVVGYTQQQFTDDTAGGHVVPAVTIGPYAISSAGNRVSETAIGPALGYNFGPVQLTAYYTRDFQHQNTIGGDSFWLRLSTRF
jgi:hypothetical protein